jgi:CCR4-NOT transcription complex subunit 1
MSAAAAAAERPAGPLLARLAAANSVASVVEELGFAASASRDTFRAVLRLLPRLDAPALAQLVAKLARTHTRPDDGGAGYAALHAALGGGALPPGPDAPMSGWNCDAIVDALAEAQPELSWAAAMGALDQPGFVLPDARCFALLCRLYARATREPFPLAAVVGGVWSNTAGQLSFLRHAVAAPPELFSWAHAPRRLLLPADCGSKASAAVLANGAWLCVDLHSTLAALAEADCLAAVRALLDAPAAACPEALLLGAAATRTQWSLLQAELFAALLPGALGLPPAGMAASSPAPPLMMPGLLHRLWAAPAGRDAILRALVDAHARAPSCLGRALDVSQELKALTAVLDATPPSFAVDLAALAARREYLNLEKWLAEAIAGRGRPFVAECLRFLRAKAAGQSDGSAPGINLSVETAALFFRALSAAAPTMPADLNDELRAVYAAAVANNPRLAALGAAAEAPMSTTAPPPPAPPVEAFSPDVEEEANAVFQKIYTGVQSIPAVVDMLAAFNVRGGRREREVFACMVHNLFDEYRFFPKYPDKELRITALLFGALVARRLVAGAHLGLALRYVLDALRKPPGTKMFAFGADAVEQFRTRVHEWPQFCAAAVQIPHLHAGAPELAAYLERAQLGVPVPVLTSQQQQQQPMSGAAELAAAAAALAAAASSYGGGDIMDGLSAADARALAGYASQSGDAGDTHSLANFSLHFPAHTAGAVSGGAAGGRALQAAAPAATPAPRLEPSAAPFSPAPSFATSLNIDTLLAAPENRAPSLPDEATVDRVHFACNNLSAANVAAKASDVALRLQPAHWPWFATYLVVKRASLEPNFHGLYLALLEAMALPALTAAVVTSAVANARVLLRGDKIKTASGERSLLKNLGSWLGVLTLGRNRPLLARHLDLKALLLEAYGRGAMIAVIPFVAKVVEPARGSRVWSPPNPWTVALLGLLAEIYAHPDLKLNLKFEVERLFKHLGVSLAETPHAGLLAGRERDRFANPDFVADKSAPAPPAPPMGGAPAVAAAAHAGAASVRSAQQLQLVADASAPPEGAFPGKDAGEPSGVGVLASGAGGLDASLLGHLTACCVLSPGVSLLAERLALKRLLPLALERAIREVVSPVVERSVTIACMTTRELVLKDFAAEPDESALRRGAHLMAASLAGSLALVTCKEPLRVSAANALRSLLAAHRAAADVEPSVVEQAVAVACGDNLELGCTLIEAAAQDKARHDVDDALASAYALRRKHREAGPPGVPFYDAGHATGRFPAALPDSLRPRPLRERPGQLRVYEDFARGPRVAAAAAAAGGGAPAAPERAGSVSSRMPGMPFMDAATAEARLGQGSGDSLLLGSQLASSRDGGFYAGDPLGAAAVGAGAGGEALVAAAVMERFRLTFACVEASAAAEPGALFDTLPADADARMAVADAVETLAAASARDDAASVLAAKALSRACERGASPAVVSASVALLEAAARASRRAGAEAAAAALYGEEEPRAAAFALDRLLRCAALDASELDAALAALLAGPRVATAAELTAALLQRAVLSADPCLAPSQLSATLEALAAAATARPGPSAEPYAALVEAAYAARGPAPASLAPAAAAGDAARSAAAAAAAAARKEPPRPRDRGGAAAGRVADPPGLRDTVATHFDEWARVCDAPAGDALYTSFFSGLAASGLVTGDEAQLRTFRILTELAVAHCLGSEPAAPPSTPGAPPVLNFAAVDAYGRLASALARHYGEATGAPPRAAGGGAPPRAAVLTRALEAAVAVLLRDQDERGGAFNPRPYFRLFSGWLAELAAPDPGLDLLALPVLGALGRALLAVQPLRAPGFAFAWLELVSHRALLPRLAGAGGPPGPAPGWPLLARLLTGCLRFLEPRLRAAELPEPVRVLYRGLLRVLLLLLHDVPEFLCDHAGQLCDAIPPPCIQMRNLVLSAFPRAMRLPDPFTPNLKVDLLPEIAASPRCAPGSDAALRGVHGALCAELDSYLVTRTPAGFPSDLRAALLLPAPEAALAGTRYNVPLLNALVLHCGAAAIAAARRDAPGDSSATGAASAPMDVFARLAAELDPEGRYLFLNALANQLRYPNAHTHYFSCVLLYLFAESTAEAVREQVTRVLLERLIVNRPHPWGLLITFIELIKNPRYAFWSHGFTRCAPEIERLFESVARSCTQPAGQHAGVAEAAA